MTSAALEKTLLRCTKCGSNNLIHFPKPNINDELVCGACGERAITKEVARLVALCPRTGSGNANEMWHQQKKVPTLRVQPLGRYGVRQTGRQEQKGPPSNRRQLLSDIRAQNKALLAGLRFG